MTSVGETVHEARMDTLDTEKTCAAVAIVGLADILSRHARANKTPFCSSSMPLTVIKDAGDCTCPSTFPDLPADACIKPWYCIVKVDYITCYRYVSHLGLFCIVKTDHVVCFSYCMTLRSYSLSTFLITVLLAVLALPAIALLH